jgi:hypothetical protein
MDVSDSNFECARIDIDRHAMRLGSMQSDGDGDGRRAGTDIEKMGGFALGKRRDGSADENFRLWPRNENARVDVEFDRVELLLSDQVSDRFSLGSLFDEVTKARSVGRGDLGVKKGIEVDSPAGEDVREKNLRIESGGVEFFLAEEARSPVQKLADGPSFVAWLIQRFIPA